MAGLTARTARQTRTLPKRRRSLPSKSARLPVDRDRVDDLAVSGGHHDVRCLDGAPVVAVVRPPDVRDERGLLDAQKRGLLGGRLSRLRLLHGVADGDTDRSHTVHDTGPGVGASLGENDERACGEVVRLPTRRQLDRPAVGQELVRRPDAQIALGDAQGSGWAERNHPDRVPATYHRTHGVRYFHGCYSVGDDRLWGVNHREKGAANTLAALQSIRAARPDGAPIYVILDNLSAHKGTDIRRRAKKHKVELCFTPTYASWANPIEAHFGPLRQFTIANSNYPNHTVQTRALHTYLRWRNANVRHRDVLAAERKERARVRSERGIHWGGRPLATAA